MMEAFAEKLMLSHSKIHELPNTSGIDGAAADVVSGVHAAFFDFDQTLTILDGDRRKHLRGGADARRFLEALHDAGVPTVVVTATKPSVHNTHTIAQELADLGVADLFGVHKPDTRALKELLKSWGPNEEMSPARLTLKLSVLLVLHTDRKVVDLPRWAHSAGASNMVAADGASVVYKLWQDSNLETLGGSHTLTVSFALS